MNNLNLKSVLFATITIASICLVGCEKPADVVAVPVAVPAPSDPVVVTVPVPVPGPAGAPGEKGDTGNTGKTGESSTTVIVEPHSAPAN